MPEPSRENVERATDMVIAWEIDAREGWEAEHATTPGTIIGPDNVDMDELADRFARALDEREAAGRAEQRTYHICERCGYQLAAALREGTDGR